MGLSNTVLLRSLLRVGLAALPVISAGCSDPTPSDDGGATPPNDATTSRDAAGDTAPDDVTSEGSPPDGDAGCACTPGAAGEKGTLPLACFCSRADLCLDYDSARSNCRSGAETWLDVHAACNLEVISFPEALAEGRKLVYDAMTHMLVGGSYATNTLSLECGTERVIGYRAGTFPASDCAVSQRLSLCGADAGSDAARDTGDAGCLCTTGDATFGQGTVSLACYCGGGFGECPTYDVALATCPPVAPPQFNRLEEYAGCNYAVITSGGGLGGAKYVFDYTTHALVGASRFTDTNILSCGMSTVFGYQAGTFPGPSCVQTKVVERCAVDGGDASDDGDASRPDALPSSSQK
jgi:hypothetical protein